jgi:hypothetical protein
VLLPKNRNVMKSKPYESDDISSSRFHLAVLVDDINSRKTIEQFPVL